MLNAKNTSALRELDFTSAFSLLPSAFPAVILTNPPFGGEEERGIQGNFPEDKQTAETALLFLQLIMRKLRRHGGSVASTPYGGSVASTQSRSGDGASRATFCDGASQPRFARASGTRIPLARTPAVETASYCQTSLRDEGGAR